VARPIGWGKNRKENRSLVDLKRFVSGGGKGGTVAHRVIVR
jgi:hypothetical protein